jgi:ABC-2 type transport system permease protein
MRGAWYGNAWTAHVGDLAGLAIFFAVCTLLSARWFRWE